MAIETTLVLSTAHINEETDKSLTVWSTKKPERQLEELPRHIQVTGHHYGHILFLPAEIEFDALERTLNLHKMQELYEIIRYASGQGCTMINFDRDAEESELFPTFSW